MYKANQMIFSTYAGSQHFNDERATAHL